QAEPVIGVDSLEGPGDQVLKQAAIEGRTLFSSTGDTGASCPIVGVPVLGTTNGVAAHAYPPHNYPSASPHPVADGPTVRSGDVGTNNGMLITDDNGADQQGAGTSLSSPLWLGFWTRVQAAAKKKGLGFANYSLYKIGKSSSYGNDFFDVTIGDNQPYPATP